MYAYCLSFFDILDKYYFNNSWLMKPAVRLLLSIN